MLEGGSRVGLGLDFHRLGVGGPLRLAGVVVDETLSLIGTSDGDVLCHAVADALLGATGMGDLGTHFPSCDPQWQGAAGLDLLGRVATLVSEKGWSVVNVDTVVVAESVRIMPHRDTIQTNLASVLKTENVSVKATTTDGMGFLGRGDGIEARAVVLMSGPFPDQEFGKSG